MRDQATPDEPEEFIFDGYYTHFVCPACGHNDWAEGDARGESLECAVCEFTGKCAGE